MAPTLTRREILQATGGTLLAGSLLTSGTDTITAQEVTEEWRQFGYDDANTGHAPDNTGPVGDITQQWHFPEVAALESSPTVDGDTVYFGTVIGVAALSAADGSVGWQTRLSTTVETKPVLANGILYVGGDDGFVYALDVSDGTEQWRFDTGGAGLSSPAVAVTDGTVYVGGSDVVDGFVYALDAADGTERWSYETGDLGEASLAVANGSVYVGSEGHNVYALNAADGTEQWRYETGDEVWSLPAVAVTDGTVYVGGSNFPDNEFVYALDAVDGTQQWRYNTGYMVSSSPTVAVTDGSVYVGSEADSVYALNAADGTEQWRFETGGSIKSSLAVANETIYVGREDDNVYALDAVDGTEKWSYATGSGVSASPAVSDGSVYVGSEGHNVYALNAADGTEQWRYETGDGIKSSPAVADGIVFFGRDDNNIYALDIADGTEQWHYETDGPVESSPAVTDGTVYVGSGDSNVYAIDAADGTEQWSYDTGGEVWSSPVVADDTVYVGSTDTRVYALDAADGTEQWSYYTGGRVLSSPAVTDDTIYVGNEDDIIYALDAADGTEQWRYETGEEVKSSPAVAEGTVYVGSDDNSVYALDARDGTEQWSYETGDLVRSSPAVADGTVFIGSLDNNVYALDAADGIEQWRCETGSKVTSSPAVADGTVYVGSEDNKVYALNAADGVEQWSYETGDTVEASPAVASGTVYIGSRNGLLCGLTATAHLTATNGVAATDEDNSLPLLPLGAGGLFASLAGVAAWSWFGDDSDTDERGFSDPDAGDTPDSGEGLVELSGEDSASGESSSPDTGAEKPSDDDTSERNVTGMGSRMRNRVPKSIRDPPALSVTWETLEREELIATGGYADVYRARHPNSDQPIAVKIPSRDTANESIAGLEDKILHTEADRWRRLQNAGRHEHIVYLYGSGTKPTSWLALEYMDGGTLADRSDELSVSELLWVGSRIADALAHAHRHMGVHHDVTPQNILFRETSSNTPPWPKLADWGLAAFGHEDRKAVDAFSQAYAAPEQLVADRYGEPSQATDIYQLGAVLYEGLTGESRPSATDKPPAPSRVAAVPDAVDDVITRALEPDQTERYSSIAHFRDTLERLLEEFE